MTSIGRKLAIRKVLSSGHSPAPARKTYFRSAITMMRSIRSKNRFCAESFRIFQRNQPLLSLSEMESQFLTGLLNQGYAIAPSFFSKELIDRIYSKADAIFRREAAVYKRRAMDEPAPYSPTGKDARNSSGPCERTVELVDPLASVPDLIDVAFHESLLKIAAYFFLHIPRIYKVSVVRHYPNHRPKCLAGIQQGAENHTSLNLIVDLVNRDDTRGMFVFVPGMRNCLTLDNGSPAKWNASAPTKAANSTLDAEESVSRNKWVVLRGERGSIVALPGGGKTGSIWSYPGDVHNNPRTSLVIQIAGYNVGEKPETGQNRILRWNFDRMTGLQQMFVHPAFIHEPSHGLAKAG